VAAVVKVSSRSSPNAVAGALAGLVRASGEVEVQVVGAGALNQAVKAIAIARMFVDGSGLDLTCSPTFTTVDIDGETRTAIRLSVKGVHLDVEPAPGGGPA
jgi:stage V sporulation protein S